MFLMGCLWLSAWPRIPPPQETTHEAADATKSKAHEVAEVRIRIPLHPLPLCVQLQCVQLQCVQAQTCLCLLTCASCCAPIPLAHSPFAARKPLETHSPICVHQTAPHVLHNTRTGHPQRHCGSRGGHAGEQGGCQAAGAGRDGGRGRRVSGRVDEGGGAVATSVQAC